ncbi:MAG: Asr1405/Asl0597 family protein [Cyanobacteria bacterium J06642_9]
MPNQDCSSSAELPDSWTGNWIEITCCDRWRVYHRLQELGVPCQCQAYRPLQADPSTAVAAVQLWSVVKQVTASQRELAQWLEGCWRLPVK